MQSPFRHSAQCKLPWAPLLTTSWPHLLWMTSCCPAARLCPQVSLQSVHWSASPALPELSASRATALAFRFRHRWRAVAHIHCQRLLQQCRAPQCLPQSGLESAAVDDPAVLSRRTVDPAVSRRTGRGAASEGQSRAATIRGDPLPASATTRARSPRRTTVLAPCREDSCNKMLT